ncbi:MAG: hypothetical protein QOI98_2823 [Solirubrobacteraceae bacterium]|jgi:peptidoglycan/LPS O-acetylase OafA/YrhL|nr:hypothetical protein [Solirubrobacteraceae bacterium]
MRAPGGSAEGDRVPDAVAPPPGNPHFPLADGARAIAMLSVVVFHAALRTGAVQGTGWHKWPAYLTFGIEMFFILSGFLLYRPFVAARVGAAPRPSFAGYARNRALRILPAYWFFLTAFAIYPGLPGDVFGHAAIYYTQTHIYFSDTVVGGLNVSWSLCVELTFYLALPLAVMAFDALCRRMHPRRARTTELALLAACVPVSWAYITAVRGHGPVSAGTFGWSIALPAQAGFFATGMLFARLSVPLSDERSLRDRITSWPLASGASFGLALALYVAHMSTDMSVATSAITNGAIAACLVAPAVFAATGDRGLERVLGWRVMKWLGLVSYGTYLAHYPILHELHDHGVGDPSFGGFLALLVVGGGISVAAGALSYYLLEQPLLRWKAGRRRRSAPVRKTA